MNLALSLLQVRSEMLSTLRSRAARLGLSNLKVTRMAEKSVHALPEGRRADLIFLCDGEMTPHHQPPQLDWLLRRTTSPFTLAILRFSTHPTPTPILNIALLFDLTLTTPSLNQHKATARPTSKDEV